VTDTRGERNATLGEQSECVSILAFVVKCMCKQLTVHSFLQNDDDVSSKNKVFFFYNK